MVFKSLGFPFILKLTPKTPSPVFFPTKIFPISGIEAIDILIKRSGIGTIISPNQLSEFDELRLRKNTKILLENLTPVIDEILLYDLNSSPVKNNE